MIYSNRFIDVAFDEGDFEKLLSALKPGDTLSAAALLAALDGESEDILQEAFGILRDMGVSLDVSMLPKTSGAGEAVIRLRREEQLVRDGQLLTALEETDPLRLYLEEIAAIPAFGDICLLAEELAKGNRDEKEDTELWTRILNLRLGRVCQLAFQHTGRGVLLLDLMQEGSMGLWSALPCYLKGDFEAFCDWHIRQAMAETVILQAYAGGLGQKMRQALEDYRTVDERLLADLGRNPTMEEIAQELHLSLEETEVVAQMLDAARTVSRAKAATEEKEPTAEDQMAVEDTAYFQMRQRITELLSNLEEEDRKLLTLRYGLEGGLPLTAEETGRKLGLTANEVVQREAAALAKLRKN